MNNRNQITVPAEVRERLQIGPGDELLLDVRDGSVVLLPEPADDVEHLRSLHAEVWRGVEPQEYVRQERGQRPRRGGRRGRQNGFLQAYGSVPALNPPRDLSEMTEIAAEEAAAEAASAGLAAHGRS